MAITAPCVSGERRMPNFSSMCRMRHGAGDLDDLRLAPACERGLPGDRTALPLRQLFSARPTAFDTHPAHVLERVSANDVAGMLAADTHTVLPLHKSRCRRIFSSVPGSSIRAIFKPVAPSRQSNESGPRLRAGSSARSLEAYRVVHPLNSSSVS